MHNYHAVKTSSLQFFNSLILLGAKLHIFNETAKKVMKNLEVSEKSLNFAPKFEKTDKTY